MAARTKSKVTPKYKPKYRVKNWPAYEASLRKRGDITVWFDEDAINASGEVDITIVIPPKKTSVVDPRAARPWRQRNDAPPCR